MDWSKAGQYLSEGKLGLATFHFLMCIFWIGVLFYWIKGL